MKNFANEQNASCFTAANVKLKNNEDLKKCFYQTASIMITKEHGIDLESILAYPITEFPQSIASADGTMAKTDKSKLANKLEKYQQCLTREQLLEITASLIDGGAFLYSAPGNTLRIPTYADLL